MFYLLIADVVSSVFFNAFVLPIVPQFIACRTKRRTVNSFLYECFMKATGNICFGTLNNWQLVVNIASPEGRLGAIQLARTPPVDIIGCRNPWVYPKVIYLDCRINRLSSSAKNTMFCRKLSIVTSFNWMDKYFR